MSWENYGRWELDHIIPVASIKNADDDEQIRCVFVWSNIRPLWKEANLNKKARIDWDEKKFWNSRG